MSEFSGSALVFQWIYSGGTVAFTGEQRNVTRTPAIKLIEKTKGSDADQSFLPGPKGGSFTLAGLIQAGGTIAEQAVAEGTSGTAIIGPEGTATGKRKYTIPAIAGGMKMSWPYADVCEYSVDFTKNGAETLGVY